jgi:tetratricopeptide (TPR) repeat protein
MGFLAFSGFLLWVLIKKKFKSERAVTLLFGILFFFVTIGLVIFMPVGSALTAERYTYIPYIGLFIALAALLTGNIKTKVSNPKSKIQNWLRRARKLGSKLQVSSLKLQIPNPEIQNPEIVNRKSQTCLSADRSKIVHYFTYVIILSWLLFLSFTTFNRLDVWKNSLNFWDDIIVKHPKNVPLAYNNRGITKYLQKDYSGAISDFTKALQQHPQLKDAYHFRALSRFAINNFADAIPDFDTTLMIDPKFADGYINRGRAKANFGDIEGAISDFSAAIFVKPNDYLPYFNRGISLSVIGKKQEAYADFSSAILHDPSFADAFFARGMIALELGNKQQACADFNEAARLGNEAAKNQLVTQCQ